MTEAQSIAGLPALLNRPAGKPRLGVLLTHGAGGDKSSRGLASLAEGICSGGYLVARFDLEYRAKGRKSPPAAEASVAGYVRAFELARDLAPVPWVAGGKSYGGRVASLAVAGGMKAVGLLFYGYPLHAPGKSDTPRVDHWPSIGVPSLFLQGTKDPFCSLEALQRSLPALGGGHTLVQVPGGGHSLEIRGADSEGGKPVSEAESVEALVPEVIRWLDSIGK